MDNIGDPSAAGSESFSLDNINMKLHLLIILTLVFSFTVFGQKPTITPAPAKENWVLLAPDKEEFSVELPGVVHLLSNFGFSSGDIADNRSYTIFLNGIYYFIFSDELGNPNLNKTAFKFAGSSADRKQENVLFKFADNSGFYYRILMIRTKKRIYTFETVSETEDSPQLNRFFDGIKISGNPFQLKEMVTNIDRKVSSADNIGGISNGSGTGQAMDSGSEKAINSGAETAKVQATPMKIKSKARPSYGNYASLHRISGSIRLLVTFQGDGTIGSVTPITRLPFGLTEQAVAAARQIKFVPQTENGKPVSIKKHIEYSFSIF